MSEEDQEVEEGGRAGSHVGVGEEGTHEEAVCGCVCACVC